jgi:hypothetical protein
VRAQKPEKSGIAASEEAALADEFIIMALNTPKIREFLVETTQIMIAPASYLP